MELPPCPHPHARSRDGAVPARVMVLRSLGVCSKSVPGAWGRKEPGSAWGVLGAGDLTQYLPTVGCPRGWGHRPALPVTCGTPDHTQPRVHVVLRWAGAGGMGWAHTGVVRRACTGEVGHERWVLTGVT